MYLTIVELAESFGVAERKIEEWARHERLPFLLERGRMLFDRGQVITWAEQRGLADKAGYLAVQNPSNDAAANVASLVKIGGIWRGIPAGQVVDTLLRIIDQLPSVTPPIRQLMALRLRAPDGISWAAVGDGLALPHLRQPVALGHGNGFCAVFFLQGPLDLPTPDGQPINRLIFLLSPSPRGHLQLLRELSLAWNRGPLKERMRAETSDEDLLAALGHGSSPVSPSPPA